VVTIGDIVIDELDVPLPHKNVPPTGVAVAFKVVD